MERTTKLLPCGCYEGACYCGQYPTLEELHTMEAARQETRNFVCHRKTWHEYQDGVTLCGKVVGHMAGTIKPASGMFTLHADEQRCSVCFGDIDRPPTLSERLAADLRDERRAA